MFGLPDNSVFDPPVSIIIQKELFRCSELIEAIMRAIGSIPRRYGNLHTAFIRVVEHVPGRGIKIFTTYCCEPGSFEEVYRIQKRDGKIKLEK